MSERRNQEEVCMTFSNGDQVFVAADLAPRIVGIDSDGDLVASDYGMLYPLTPCCHASGKGMGHDDEDGGYVGCRSCHEEVDDKYGMVYDDSHILAYPVENGEQA